MNGLTSQEGVDAHEERGTTPGLVVVAVNTAVIITVMDVARWLVVVDRNRSNLGDKLGQKSTRAYESCGSEELRVKVTLVDKKRTKKKTKRRTAKSKEKSSTSRQEM